MNLNYLGAPKNIVLNITVSHMFGFYEVPLESSRTVIVVTAAVKEDERGDQGNTSTSLLHQSAT
jgi:hypothetical protein